MPRSIKQETLYRVIDFLKQEKRFVNKSLIRQKTKLSYYSIEKVIPLLESGNKLEILSDGKLKFYKWKK